MNTAVSFTTPNGEELVILSRTDYDALLRQAELAEDLEDLQAVRTYEARLAAGEEELIPAEFVNRLIDGESPIRVWRDFRGLSGRDLAAACDMSAAYLSEIETGKKEGSLPVLKTIAKALKLDLEDLLWNRDETSVTDD